MNTLVNIILVVSFYPILPILYFMLRNESKPKKNIILGVTLPYDARQDERVSLISQSFNRHLGITTLILTILIFCIFFIEYSSISTLYIMIWLLAAIVALYASFTIYHRKLQCLKQDNNWTTGAAGKVMLDTKVSVQPQKQLSAWLFFPPVILSFIPIIQAVYSKSNMIFLITYVINAFFITTFYLFYKVLYRQRAEVIDSDTTLSMALTQVRHYNWCKVWIGLAWFTGLFNLFFWLFISSITGIMVCTIVYTAASLFIIINTEFTVRKAQEKLTENSGKDVYVDDDIYWINGMFYYNPNDSHSFIKARLGINLSVNFAKPAGKIVISICFLALGFMLFMGVWMLQNEFIPVRIEITDTSVEAHHTELVYKIDLSDIESVALIDTLPSVSKINGTDMAALLKGKFRAVDIGVCELILNPKISPFVVIKTEDIVYIFNTNDEEKTRMTYTLLTSQPDK